jgi:hypothetical protein
MTVPVLGHGGKRSTHAGAAVHERGVAIAAPDDRGKKDIKISLYGF